jgi:hypothetical protein
MNWHPVLEILWYLFWPASEVFGRPESADKDIPSAKLWKLIGIAVCVSVVIFLIFFV